MSNHIHLLIRPRRGASISRLVQSLLVSHTHRYHKHYRSGGHVWQGRFKSPVIQDDEHLLTVLRYIEANPLRARIVERAEDYPWSSYRVHGLGTADELVDPLVSYEQISPRAKSRQSKWAQRVHEPLAEPQLEAIRRSVNSGLPYGEEAWLKRLALRLKLDLITRPRGRPRKTASDTVKIVLTPFLARVPLSRPDPFSAGPRKKSQLRGQPAVRHRARSGSSTGRSAARLCTCSTILIHCSAAMRTTSAASSAGRGLAERLVASIATDINEDPRRATENWKPGANTGLGGKWVLDSFAA